MRSAEKTPAGRGLTLRRPDKFILKVTDHRSGQIKIGPFVSTGIAVRISDFIIGKMTNRKTTVNLSKVPVVYLITKRF